MATEDRVSRSTPIRNETVVEIVGYVGVAMALAGTGVALARRTDLSERNLFVVMLAVTAVLVFAGVAIGDRLPDAYQRMRSVLWFAAVQSFGEAAALCWTSIAHVQGNTAVTLTAASSAAFALILWLVLRRSLQQIAFFLTVVATLVVVVVPSTFTSASDERDPLLVLSLSGAVWFVLGTMGMVRPPRTARVLGAVVALVGALYLFAVSFALAMTLITIFALGLLISGDLQEDRAVAGLGIVGILIAAPVAVARAVHDSTGAVVTIVVGLILLAGAIVWLRASSRPTAVESEPPVPPPPIG